MAERSGLTIALELAVAGKASEMTCAMISGVKRLRMMEIDRKARRENLASKSETARSIKAKLLLISAFERHVSDCLAWAGQAPTTTTNLR